VDYESSIKSDPIALLNAIEEYSFSVKEKRFAQAVLRDSLSDLVNIKQKQNESLHDFAARVKSIGINIVARWGEPLAPAKTPTRMRDQKDSTIRTKIKDLIAAIDAGGTTQLSYLAVAKTPTKGTADPQVIAQAQAAEQSIREKLEEILQQMDSHEAQKKKFRAEEFEAYLAYTFMVTADKKKYGSWVVNAHNEFVNGRDIYPKTVSQALNILLSQIGDHQKSESSTSGKSEKQDSKKKPGEKKKKQDNDSSAADFSLAQFEKACWCCGKPGHNSDNCHHKKKPKN
jgi:hypothetical protein